MPDILNLSSFTAEGTDAEVARIQAEAAAKVAATIAEAEGKGRLLRALAAAPGVPEALAGVEHFHHAGSALYGSVASLDLGSRWSRHCYGAEGPRQLTVADLLPLAAAFPAVPMLQHRDGCVGHRPRDYVDKRDENRNPTLTNMAPVWIHGGTWGELSSPPMVEWWADVPEVGRVRFHCHLPGRPALQGFGVTADADRDWHGEVVRWRNPRTTLPEWFHMGSPIYKDHWTIRYAAGSAKYLPTLCVLFRPELSALDILTELAMRDITPAKVEG